MADHTDGAEETRAERARRTQAELQQTFLDRAANVADLMLQGFEELTLKDWRRFARKAPDRHAQGLTQIARLAGLTQPEKVQIDIRGFILELQTTCDSHLEQAFGVTSSPPMMLTSGGSPRKDA